MRKVNRMSTTSAAGPAGSISNRTGRLPGAPSVMQPKQLGSPLSSSPAGSRPSAHSSSTNLTSNNPSPDHTGSPGLIGHPRQTKSPNRPYATSSGPLTLQQGCVIGPQAGLKPDSPESHYRPTSAGFGPRPASGVTATIEILVQTLNKKVSDIQSDVTNINNNLDTLCRVVDTLSRTVDNLSRTVNILRPVLAPTTAEILALKRLRTTHPLSFSEVMISLWWAP